MREGTVEHFPGLPGDPGLLGRVLLLLEEPRQLPLAPAPMQVHPDPAARVELDARVGLLGLQAVERARDEVGQHARPRHLGRAEELRLSHQVLHLLAGALAAGQAGHSVADQGRRGGRGRPGRRQGRVRLGLARCHLLIGCCYIVGSRQRALSPPQYKESYLDRPDGKGGATDSVREWRLRVRKPFPLLGVCQFVIQHIVFGVKS